ncbi:MAG TPA: DUF2127 domain-containing protein [Terriglobales bacterium]|nr:DUF2127 domain-containing protein [Terriglobales bacterium]
MQLKAALESVHHGGADLEHLKGLRAVASLEFLKGILACGGIIALIAIVRRDTWDVAESLLEFFHVNLEGHFAQAFLDFADRVTDKNLWTAVGLLSVYTLLRFIESYGLWRARAWAEWLALISGTIYLPFEIMELIRKPDAIHVFVLLANLVVVLYMLYLRTWGRVPDEQRRSGVRAYEPGD